MPPVLQVFLDLYSAAIDPKILVLKSIIAALLKQRIAERLELLQYIGQKENPLVLQKAVLLILDEANQGTRIAVQATLKKPLLMHLVNLQSLGQVQLSKA